MQIESGKRQLEKMNKQAQMVEGALGEGQMTVEALKSLKQQKPGTQMAGALSRFHPLTLSHMTAGLPTAGILQR